MGSSCSDGGSGCLLCVVLKSNAYGHGIRRLAPLAFEAGADVLAIATNADAAAIRESCGATAGRVMRLRVALQHEVRDQIARGLDVEEMVGSLATARALSAIARELGTVLRVHLNLDSGMGRMGFLAGETETVKRLLSSSDRASGTAEFSNVRVVGALTHFPSADADSLASTREAAARFRRAWVDSGVLPKRLRVGCANSSATQVRGCMSGVWLVGEGARGVYLRGVCWEVEVGPATSLAHFL